MRIAIDARPLTGPLSGIARYTGELIRELALIQGLELLLYSDGPIGIEFSCLGAITVRQFSARAPLSGTLKYQYHFPRWALEVRADVFWAPNQELPILLPGDIPSVLTVHDLVSIRFPHTMRVSERLKQRVVLKSSMKRASQITPVSKFTLSEILKLFPATEGRLVLVENRPSDFIVEPASPETVNLEAPGRFALYVGTVEPRKNLPALINAFSQLLRRQPNMHLVIAGASGWGRVDLEGEIQSAGISNSVTWLGRIEDASLRWLYENSEFLILPSFYEGYGLPAIESLYYGKPVVVTPDTGVYFKDVDGIVRCGSSSPEDLCRGMIQACDLPYLNVAEVREQLGSWKDSAAQLHAVFESIAN